MTHSNIQNKSTHRHLSSPLEQTMSSLRRTSSHNCGNNNNDPGREGPRCSPDGGAGSQSTRRSTDGGITQIPFAVSNGGDDNAGISSSGGGDGVAGDGGNLVSARGELSSGVSNQNSGSSDSPGHENNICVDGRRHTTERVALRVPVSCIGPFHIVLILLYHPLITFSSSFLHF